MNRYEHIGFDAISNNAADFSKALMGIADYVDGSFEKVVRKACIDLYRAIVEKTPVKFGRAKASWSLATSHASDVHDNEDGYSFNEIDQIIQENVSGFKLSVHDSTVFIYNNIEYIEYLENGTSKQAPAGMVSISLVEFETFFNNALRGLEGISGT